MMMPIMVSVLFDINVIEHSSEDEGICIVQLLPGELHGFLFCLSGTNHQKDSIGDSTEDYRVGHRINRRRIQQNLVVFFTERFDNYAGNWQAKEFRWIAGNFSTRDKIQIFNTRSLDSPFGSIGLVRDHVSESDVVTDLESFMHDRIAEVAVDNQCLLATLGQSNP